MIHDLSDRELLEKCLEEFRLINRLNIAPGFLKFIKEGKEQRITKKAAITAECTAAIRAINEHLKENGA